MTNNATELLNLTESEVKNLGGFAVTIEVLDWIVDNIDAGKRIVELGSGSTRNIYQGDMTCTPSSIVPNGAVHAKIRRISTPHFLRINGTIPRLSSKRCLDGTIYSLSMGHLLKILAATAVMGY